MSYEIELSKQAYRDLDNLPANLRSHVETLIDSLAENPYPPRSKSLREPLDTFYRIPIETWRIIYEVKEDIIQVVYIHRVKRKKGPETYENLYDE